MSVNYRDGGLFVDADSEDQVLGLLKRHFDTDDEFGSIEVRGFEVRVGRNQLKFRGKEPASFVDWEVMVDVYADERISDREMVRFVGELMEFLRASGHRVVAEADFAAELPPSDWP